MMITVYYKKRCAAFHSRRESITGESPTTFLEENTTMPYSGFEPEPVRLQAELHIHHTGWTVFLLLKYLYMLLFSKDKTMLLSCVYYWDTYERREIDEQKHITQPQKNTDLLQTMIPEYNKKSCAAFPFETGIHFRRKTDFFPEEDTNKSYSGFEPEPTWLQTEGHSHHTRQNNEHVNLIPLIYLLSHQISHTKRCHSPKYKLFQNIDDN
ncbi:hypothetical protein TNCV_3955181 [Trichonephila clavipes]|nr:hypothetical protein TNCV_3955181 [Trichonephila clavipes]